MRIDADENHRQWYLYILEILKKQEEFTISNS